EVRNEITDHMHMRQRVDGDPAGKLLERLEAGQAVVPVHVHRAGAADALAAGAAEGQRRIDLILDLEERIEDHRPAAVHVDPVRVESGAVVLVGMPAIDAKLRPATAFAALVPGPSFGDARVRWQAKLNHGALVSDT